MSVADDLPYTENKIWVEISYFASGREKQNLEEWQDYKAMGVTDMATAIDIHSYLITLYKKALAQEESISSHRISQVHKALNRVYYWLGEKVSTDHPDIDSAIQALEESRDKLAQKLNNMSLEYQKIEKPTQKACHMMRKLLPITTSHDDIRKLVAIQQCQHVDAEYDRLLKPPVTAKRVAEVKKQGDEYLQKVFNLLLDDKLLAELSPLKKGKRGTNEEIRAKLWDSLTDETKKSQAPIVTKIYKQMGDFESAKDKADILQAINDTLVHFAKPDMRSRISMSATDKAFISGLEAISKKCISDPHFNPTDLAHECSDLINKVAPQDRPLRTAQYFVEKATGWSKNLLLSAPKGQELGAEFRKAYSKHACAGPDSKQTENPMYNPTPRKIGRP